MNVTIVKQGWISQFKIQMATSPYYQDLLDRSAHGQLDPHKYTVRDGVIFYKNRLLIDPQSPFVITMLQEHHDTPTRRYSGVQKTMQRLKSCYWKGTKRDVKEYVKTCDVYERNKAENTTPAGLLQPLPIPENIWEDISMDFIEGLPLSHHQSTILVVVDRLTKYIHLFPLSHPYNAIQFPKLL